MISKLTDPAGPGPTLALQYAMGARDPSQKSLSPHDSGTATSPTREADIHWERSFFQRISGLIPSAIANPGLRRRTRQLTATGLLLITAYAGWLGLKATFPEGLFAALEKWYQSAGERQVASQTEHTAPKSTDDKPATPALATAEKTKPKSIVILAGGGCEAPDSNDFAPEFKKSIDSFTNSGVELHVLFGSPHTQTSILKPLGKIRAFNAANLDQEFATLLERTDLNAGDSVLIQINTHGRKPENGRDHELCYDVPEDGELKTEGAITTTDLQISIGMLRSKHPDVRIAVIDQSCFGGATVDALSSVRGVCTLSSVSARLPAEYNEYFNHQFERALSHGHSMTRSFESALKDRFLRVRRNQDTPRMSGIPSADLNTYIKLIEWGGLTSTEWEESLERESSAETLVPPQQYAGAHPEHLMQLAAVLSGLPVGDIEGARQSENFADIWLDVSRLHEGLESLAAKGLKGAAATKRTRAVRKLAQRVRSRLDALRDATEKFAATWATEEGKGQLLQAITQQDENARNWDLYVKVRGDISPVLLELGRLRLRLGDIHRLLRELDPESLIRDETGSRNLEAWEACSDFKLHVNLGL